MAGTEYFGETAVQPRDHIPVNTTRKSHNHTLSPNWQGYPQPLIILSRLTQAKYHRITRKNSAHWQINTSGRFSYIVVLFKFPDVDSHGRRTTLVLFSHQVKVHLQFCSHLIRLTPKCLFPSPQAKGLVVTLEKRTISNLSVSARIRVIDPFSQIKRELNLPPKKREKAEEEDKPFKASVLLSSRSFFFFAQ